MYDGDTISVLQSSAVIGSSRGHGVAAITITPVSEPGA